MVASAFAMKKEDWMISSYREMGSHLVRGTSIQPHPCSALRQFKRTAEGQTDVKQLGQQGTQYSSYRCTNRGISTSGCRNYHSQESCERNT